MNIDNVQNGYVIDHIAAGGGIRLFDLLGLRDMECPVAFIKNVPSKKMGKKDIIKIDSVEADVNLDIIGYVDPSATVNVIKDGELVEKKVIGLPEELTNVIFCKNPRCITSTEQELKHVFRLTDRGNKVYRCIYCESKAEIDK